MALYLIDANLPRYFSVWSSADYVHQIDINPRWDDRQIWNYAIKNQLTIVSKDSDFTHRILMSVPPPRVIHIRLGNMPMRRFHELVSSNWHSVLEMSQTHKLVIMWEDRLEGVR